MDGDINAVNNAGETPFLIAAREGRSDLVRLYVKEYPGQFDIEHKSKDGWSALMYATINSHSSIVTFLVKHGEADINTTDRL